jgi:hypothetical protein
MSKRALLLSSMLVIGLAMPALAQDTPEAAARPVNITGVWSLTVAAPQGDFVNDATFTQENETLKVAMMGPQGMPMDGVGTVKEGAVQWAVTIDTPNGLFSISFAGKVDGDQMSGGVQMGDFGTATWSAKKKQPAQ